MWYNFFALNSRVNLYALKWTDSAEWSKRKRKRYVMFLKRFHDVFLKLERFLGITLKRTVLFFDVLMIFLNKCVECGGSWNASVLKKRCYLMLLTKKKIFQNPYFQDLLKNLHIKRKFKKKSFSATTVSKTQFYFQS